MRGAEASAVTDHTPSAAVVLDCSGASATGQPAGERSVGEACEICLASVAFLEGHGASAQSAAAPAPKPEPEPSSGASSESEHWPCLVWCFF